MVQKPFFLLRIMSLTLTLSVSASGVISPAPAKRPEFSPFKPTVAVIIGALTAIFSITLLLLLYARHVTSSTAATADHPAAAPERKKNSGVSRAVVESLPVYRFGEGHVAAAARECAVCLGKYGRSEVLRLLPKCRHAFHVECVDTWLDAHSTCPLCRLRVDPEDVLLLRRNIPRRIAIEPRVISNRHSSAGERAFLRRSLDSLKRLKNNHNNNNNNIRKDGKLLEERSARNDYRWSDVQPSDLISLQSEMMIMSASERLSNDSVRVGNDNTTRRSRWAAFWVSQRQLPQTASS